MSNTTQAYLVHLPTKGEEGQNSSEMYQRILWMPLYTVLLFSFRKYSVHFYCSRVIFFDSSCREFMWAVNP